MHPLVSKTLGGLSFQYYFRHFLFGLIFPAMFVFSLTDSGHNGSLLNFSRVSFFIVSTFLYPYSRFVYEKVVGFILGNNVFWVNSWLAVFIKIITMVMCWGFAIFIAPIGLVYLYFYHSKILHNSD